MNSLQQDINKDMNLNASLLGDNSLSTLPFMGGGGGDNGVGLQLGPGNQILNRNRQYLLSTPAPYTAKLKLIMKFCETQNKKLNSNNNFSLNIFNQSSSSNNNNNNNFPYSGNNDNTIGGGSNLLNLGNELKQSNGGTKGARKGAGVRVVDYGMMQIIKELVYPENEGLITALTQTVRSKSMTFKHAFNIIKPAIDNILKMNWEPQIDQFFIGCIQYGFILFRMKPHAEVYKVPIILNPFHFYITYTIDEFSKNVYTIYDLANNDVSKEVFIYDMYPPGDQGEITSPLAHLITPTISYIFLQAAYEQSIIQQHHPDRVLSVAKFPTPNVQPRDNGEEERPALLAKSLVLGKMPDGRAAPITSAGYVNDTEQQRIAREDEPTGLTEDFLREMMKTFARTGQTMDQMKMSIQFMKILKDNSMVVHPPDVIHPNAIIQLAPGFNIQNLPAAGVPDYYLELLEQYRRICSQQLNLPLELTNTRSTGRIYSSESDLVLRRTKEAAFVYANTCNQLFNLMLAHIYGTSDNYLACERQIESIQEQQLLNKQKQKEQLRLKRKRDKENGIDSDSSSSSDSDSDSDSDSSTKKRKKIVRQPKKLKEALEQKDAIIQGQNILHNITIQPGSDSVTDTTTQPIKGTIIADNAINTHLENHDHTTNTDEVKTPVKVTTTTTKSNKIKSKPQQKQNQQQSNISSANKFRLEANGQFNHYHHYDHNNTDNLISEEEVKDVLNLVADGTIGISNPCGLTVKLNWLTMIEDLELQDKINNNNPEVVRDLQEMVQKLRQQLAYYSGSHLLEDEIKAFNTTKEIDHAQHIQGHSYVNSYVPNYNQQSMNDPLNMSVDRSYPAYGIGDRYYNPKSSSKSNSDDADAESDDADNPNSNHKPKRRKHSGDDDDDDDNDNPPSKKPKVKTKTKPEVKEKEVKSDNDVNMESKYNDTDQTGNKTTTKPKVKPKAKTKTTTATKEDRAKSDESILDTAAEEDLDRALNLFVTMLENRKKKKGKTAKKGSEDKANTTNKKK